MSQTSLQCPKCQNKMEQGFSRHLFGAEVLGWVRGVPRKSWRGPSPEVTSIPIGAFRCTACGYLELYARNEFGAQ
jgi:hypothetical protein